MKNFIRIFILLMAINIFVPHLYYQLYHGIQDSNLLNNDNFLFNDPFAENTESNTQTYTLYNLETQEMDEFDIISFLVGSAACEMPASYNDEAIKAQMIACHSYYLYCKEHGMPDDDMNLSYDQRSMQKYASKERLKEYWGNNFDEYYEKFLRCADEVKNVVVKYNGEVALTPYFAVSCGMTQSSEKEWGQALPYLVPVESDDALSTDYLKIRTYTVDEMYDRFMLNFAGLDLDREQQDAFILQAECAN